MPEIVYRTITPHHSRQMSLSSKCLWVTEIINANHLSECRYSMSLESLRLYHWCSFHKTICTNRQCVQYYQYLKSFEYLSLQTHYITCWIRFILYHRLSNVMLHRAVSKRKKLLTKKLINYILLFHFCIRQHGLVVI